MSFEKQPVKQELVPFQKENVSPNQTAVPLPFFGGTRLVAGRFISSAEDEVTIPVESGGKKG